MNRTVWTPTLGWLAAAAAALALAYAAPSESSLMGRLPSLSAKRLDQQLLMLPQGLPAERTLALVTFRRDHRVELDSWIQGLGLDKGGAIPWLKMPVLNDPGDEQARAAIESRLRARHANDAQRLVPVFTDREAFVRAAGLSGADHASVLVLGRDGTVLARAEGGFDQGKAQALRETLLGPAGPALALPPAKP